MSKRVITIVSAMAMTAALIVSCSDDGGKLRINEGLDGRVGDSKITKEEIDERIETMSPQFKSKYRGRQGRARLVDDLINEELLYLAASNTDLIYDEEVKKKIKNAERTILVTAYYDKMIKQKVDVTEEEIEEYYNDHWDEFMNRSIIKAQHAFSKDSMQVVEWKKRIEDGEKFNKIAKYESEDRMTAPSNGNLGYFNPGGYVKFYGESEEFSRQIEHLDISQVSDVVVTEKGYSIVKINDKKPESLKPLSEVRSDIVDKLRSEEAKANLEKRLKMLRDEYQPVNFVREEIIKTTRTPEELWQIAQEEDANFTRIQYYRNLVNKYPDHKYAPQALFMIGFVYAEEIQDLVQARRVFDELLKKYPDSEVTESARWMIENLEKPHPKFESVEDMKEHMEGGTDGQE
jgi:peptidyl-prolyl cis-trans isomerase C